MGWIELLQSDREQLYAAGRVGCMNAFRSYDSQTAAWSTWVYQQVLGEVTKYIRSSRDRFIYAPVSANIIINPSDKIDVFSSGFNPLIKTFKNKLEFSQLLDTVRLLTDFQKKVLQPLFLKW